MDTTPINTPVSLRRFASWWWLSVPVAALILGVIFGAILFSKQTQAPIPMTAYDSAEYNFEIQYPAEYKVVTGESGWPNALFLLYNGGQSYDIAVEAWDTKDAFEQARHQSPDVIQLSNGKYITVWDVTKEAGNKAIISSFKYTDPTASMPTYSNDQFGFSFRYPANFTIVTKTNSDYPKYLEIDITNSNDQNSPIQLLINNYAGFGPFSSSSKVDFPNLTTTRKTQADTIFYEGDANNLNLIGIAKSNDEEVLKLILSSFSFKK